MSQVRKLNENSNRRYQFYDRRIKNLLRKIHTDSREKPGKNTSEVSYLKITESQSLVFTVKNYSFSNLMLMYSSKSNSKY